MAAPVIHSAVYVSAGQVEKPLFISLIDCFIFTCSLSELRIICNVRTVLKLYCIYILIRPGYELINKQFALPARWLFITSYPTRSQEIIVI